MDVEKFFELLLKDQAQKVLRKLKIELGKRYIEHSGAVMSDVGLYRENDNNQRVASCGNAVHPREQPDGKEERLRIPYDLDQ